MCFCSPPLHSCGAVHRLQWLWQCRWCWQWLWPGRRQRLLLWQWSRPWRWLQFWQWQRLWRWPQLCWGQQFHHQIQHHLILQQEGLQALKASHWHLVQHCLKASSSAAWPSLQVASFLLSQISLGPWVKLKLPSPHFLNLFLLDLSFH